MKQETEVNFERMEKEVLDEIMATSKSMLETFKFKMIYGAEVKGNIIDKTLKGLSEFRKRHWKAKTGKNEAYKEYLNLY